MDEQTKGFRSAVFGGFRREDVLRYIEETDAKYYEESERLRSSLDDAQTAMGELRGQNEKLTEKNAELLERLGAMTLDMDRIQAQLDEIEKGFSLQTTEIEAQNERAETLAAENDRLTSENAKLAAKCGEYDQSKDKIAEMELSAYRRAKQIEEDAAPPVARDHRAGAPPARGDQGKLPRDARTQPAGVAGDGAQGGRGHRRDRPHLGLPRKKHNGKIEKRAARYAEQSAPENGGKIKWLIMI